MTVTPPDTRAITLVDIPLLRRLSGSGTVLDSELGLTRDARGAYSAHLSGILFPRGVYTLVARSDSQRVVGQFRYRQDDLNAHITYIAPTLSDDTEDTVWLHILDAMAREAGKHGAHALIAEVETSSRLFEVMRIARFATYIRQTIWRHEPVQNLRESQVTLTEENNQDQMGILALITCTVPNMLQQIAAPPGDMRGLVYRVDDRIKAYVALSEGENGIYIIPYIHQDVQCDTADILRAAIHATSRAHKVPIYVSVRSYQVWLDSVLQRLDFESWVEQAIMVKHIAAGIRHPGFTNTVTVNNGKLEVAHQGAPPTWTVARHVEKEETT